MWNARSGCGSTRRRWPYSRGRFPPAAEETAHASKVPARAISPADSMQLLARAGFPLTRFRRAGSEEEAAAAARGIGFPVAVKMNSPDVTHKSDAGGVFLNVADETGGRAAFRAVRDAGGGGGG